MVLQSFQYVGLTKEQIQNDKYIRELVFSLLDIDDRILYSKNYSIDYKNSQQLNGVPVTEITFSCNEKDQYCSGCDCFGCPGGC